MKMTISEQNGKPRNHTNLGAILRAKREANGYTQKALASALGLEYYTLISQMELGYTAIPPSLWGPIADTLRMDREDWLLTCLDEIHPEIYRQFFGLAPKAETMRMMKFLRYGSLESELDKVKGKL